MKTALKIIDTITEYNGQIFLWMSIALMGVMSYESIARFAFNSPTQWAYETAEMIGGTLAVMAWSYTLLHKAHIRVDVIYHRLSLRGQALVDVVCTLILLFPLLAILAYASTNAMLFSWKIGEKLTESSWMPPAGPIRTVMVIGLALFTLQSLAQFTRDVYQLIRSKPYA